MHYPRVPSFCHSLLRWKGRRKQLGQRLVVDDKESQVRSGQAWKGKGEAKGRRDDLHYIITHALPEFRSFPAVFTPADTGVGAATRWTVPRAL